MKILRSLSAVLDNARKRIWNLADGDPEIIHHRTGKPFEHFQPPQAPSAFAEMIRSRANEVHEEYIHRIKGDLLIDPRSGFVIRDRSTLIAGSLPNVERAYRPALASWAGMSTGIASTVKLQRCISLRDVFEANYFHFFNDVLTRISLLEQAGLLNVPLVIGHALYRTAFFQAVLPKLTKAGVEVIDQGRSFIRSEEIIYCRTIPFDRMRYDRVHDLLETPNALNVEKCRRVFLTRGRGSHNKRMLANKEEVHRLMLDQGIEVHDPATLTMDEQIDLLAGTSQLIGSHGAGLTNMIFRRGAPLELLEIFPADHMPPHYYWLAQMYGYEHRSMIAGRTDARGTFEIPIAQLSEALGRMGSSASQ